MAAKRSRTFYEALQAAKGNLKAEPPASPRQKTTVPERDVGTGPAGPPREPGLHVPPRRAGIRVPWRVVLPAAGAVAVLAVVIAAVLASRSRFGGDARLRSLDEVLREAPRTEVLDNTGPSSIDRRLLSFTGVAGSAEGVGGDASGRGPRVIEGRGTDETLSGDWRVRIFSTARNRKAELDKAIAFLREKGIPTTYESRQGFYLLYSKQTFPFQSHPEAVALRDRIRELGNEFAVAGRSGTNEFDSAFIATPRPR